MNRMIRESRGLRSLLSGWRLHRRIAGILTVMAAVMAIAGNSTAQTPQPTVITEQVSMRKELIMTAVSPLTQYVGVGGQVPVAVEVKDKMGNPTAGVAIVFKIPVGYPGTLTGGFKEVTVATGSDGKASVTLTAGMDPVECKVTASAAANFPEVVNAAAMSFTIAVLPAYISIADPGENDVHLKGEEVRFRSAIEPAYLIGVTYAWSVLDGTCDPASSATEDFQTTLKSKGTIRVKLVATIGGTTYERIRSIKAILPEVTELSWKNDHDLLQGATGNNAIVDPVWTKTLGGAVTKNEAGAYSRNDYATAELKIDGGMLLTHPTSVQVRGAGNTEDFAAQGAIFRNWAWSSGELQLESSPLYASVNFYDRLNVTWYYRIERLSGGWGDWVEMNQSQHPLYTTLATPTSPEATPHALVIDYACRWAANSNTAGNVCSAILTNGFEPHYTWVGNCNVLSSDFIRMLASLGIAGQQHRWRSKYFYPNGSPHIGAMVQQRTISFTPVGGSAGSIDWWWHQWAEADSQQRDPSAASSHAGNWGDYEDYLFTGYRECTQSNSTPYQTQWVPNQPGQSSGCEAYPANSEYLSGPLADWIGPDR